MVDNTEKNMNLETHLLFLPEAQYWRPSCEC